MSTARHIAALDGLRAIAILLVIPHNANIYGEPPAAFWPLAMLAYVGWIGVQLFFVLSGYLITTGLMARKGEPHYFRNFYLRRALRILPLYYLVLALGFFLQPPLTAASGQGLPWLWLFLSNWVQPFGLAVPGFIHFWSLAVEEQFYLLWPLAVLALSRRQLGIGCALMILIAGASRLTLWSAGAPAEAYYVFTICRMDALAMGALAAMALRGARLRNLLAGQLRWLFSAAVLTVGGGALLTHLYDRHDWRTLTFGEPLLAMAFAVMIVAAVLTAELNRSSIWTRVLAWRPLRAIGRYSFGMYVLHLPLLLIFTAPLQRWLQPAGRAAPPLFALLMVGLSLLGGWASYTFLERYFLAMKTRFAPGAPGMRTSSTALEP